MWTLFVMIGIGLLIALMGFLPSYLAWSGYVICFLAGFILSITFLVYYFAMRSIHKENIFPFISIGLYVLYFLIMPPIYQIVKGYAAVTREMDKYHVSYSLKGVQKDATFMSYENCGYSYQFQLKDSPNLTFKAANCDTNPAIIKSYQVVYNYGEVAFPYYFEQYQKDHSTSFTIEKKDSFDDQVYRPFYQIYYQEDNCKEVSDFLEYLAQESSGFIAFEIDLVETVSSTRSIEHKIIMNSNGAISCP